MTDILYSIRNLSVDYHTRAGILNAVDNVSLDIRRGEVLGLVGESGCGKSTLGKALLRMIPEPGIISSGQLWFNGSGNNWYNGSDLMTLSERQMRDVRGKSISMVFQDPMTSLNPVQRIVDHLTETIQTHEPQVSDNAARARAEDLVDRLGIRRERIDDYPHQLSGGMRQRVMISLALSLQADLVIADEATTSLDVIVEAQFLDLLKELCAEFNLTIILITHNIGIVAQLADRVAVMYAGRMAEIGEAQDIFTSTLHPYASGLLKAVPNIKILDDELYKMEGAPPNLILPPSGCRFHPRCPKVMDICSQQVPQLKAYDNDHMTACWLYEEQKESENSGKIMSSEKDNHYLVELQDVKKWFPLQQGLFSGLFGRENTEYIRAVDGVSFKIEKGEVFGLAGESGSGKTTVGRLALGLLDVTEGKVIFDGVDLSTLSAEEMRHGRHRMQVIFQDPMASLSPRMTIGEAVAHPLIIHYPELAKDKKKQVFEVLENVGLAPASYYYDKYPHQISGGQRQRVVIARALITKPALILADEPIAMADVSVRALLLDLMNRLKEEYNLTYLFITHDLATAKYICDRIGIMYLGKLVEVGPLKEVFTNPVHPYTRALLAAVPVPDPNQRRKEPLPRGEIPSPINPPSGCRFHPRCPIAEEICKEKEPQMLQASENAKHLAACHLRTGQY